MADILLVTIHFLSNRLKLFVSADEPIYGMREESVNDYDYDAMHDIRLVMNDECVFTV